MLQKLYGKNRNYHRQISSNLIAMGLNMHGNPLIIASAYMPHDDTNDDRVRQRAWEDLTNFMNETLEAINTTIIGYLNTNTHARKREEEGHIGPHIYGRGIDLLRNKEHNTPANKTTNRGHMVNHLRTIDMKVADIFSETRQLKGTYQRKDNVDGGPPWSTDRYCEVDHCLVRTQWMNSIINIQADPYTNINTDRKSVEIRIRQKLLAREQPNKEPSLKGLKPEKQGMTSEKAIKEYNSKFRGFVEEAWGTEETETGCLYKLTKDAAKHAFNKPKGKGKRQDCDARLRRILDDRKVAIINHGDFTVKRLTRNLKQLARQIKIRH